MNPLVTLDTIRDALKRIESSRHIAADVVLLREWIARQESIIAFQADRIAELRAHEDALAGILDEEA